MVAKRAGRGVGATELDVVSGGVAKQVCALSLILVAVAVA